jgi:sec-independent protein translocase protein TatB
MFNMGPLEFVVLAFVGVVVLGPDRLPGLARDAARMLRTLREMATGARTQLREELGPEFADIDLRSLNPRTAITQALLGDDVANGMSPRAALQNALFGDPAAANGSNGSAPSAAAPADSGDVKPVSRPPVEPLGRNEAAPYDPDAT